MRIFQLRVGHMKASNALGFAIGCIVIMAAEHALSKNDSPPRFTDPDLIALEKVTARAKRAMDAFVLRPRMPDAYDSVCIGCSPYEGSTSIIQLARSAVDTPQDVETTSALEAPRSRKRRYSVIPMTRHAKRAASRRLRISLKKPRLGRGFEPSSSVSVSWETELRR